MSSQYDTLISAITDGNVNAGVKEALALVDGGIKPIELFTKGIEPTLAIVGEKFSRLEIFLPEMISSADVVKAIQAVLKPIMEKNQTSAVKGKIVIATVSGDLHDIGKNIVKVMLEVNGYEVTDLGVDVDARAIIKTAREINADFIALSALMIPSLPFVKDVIDFVDPHDEIKVIVGGGPVSKVWADESGADGYGDDAMQAVEIVKQLLN